MAIEVGRWSRIRSLALPGLLTLGAALLAVGCRPSRDGIDPATLPVEMRSDYEVFARRCSKCHSLARPLTSGITDNAQWVSYVTRMRMQPGSGITEGDQVVILRFLKFYSAEEVRKKAEANGIATTTPSAGAQVAPVPSPPTPPANPPPPPSLPPPGLQPAPGSAP